MTISKSALSNAITNDERSVVSHHGLIVSSLSEMPLGAEAQNSALDILAQFKANINQVDSLVQRLKFVVGEVGYVVKNQR